MMHSGTMHHNVKMCLWIVEFEQLLIVHLIQLHCLKIKGPRPVHPIE